MCVCVCVGVIWLWAVCLWVTCLWITCLWVTCLWMTLFCSCLVYVCVVYRIHRLYALCYTSLTPRRVHCLRLCHNCLSNLSCIHYYFIMFVGYVVLAYIFMCLNKVCPWIIITLLCYRDKYWCVYVYVCLYMYMSESLLFY